MTSCNQPDKLAGRGASYSAPTGTPEDTCEPKCDVSLSPETIAALKPTGLEMAQSICGDPAAAEILKGCIDTDTQNTHALDEDGNLVITSADGSETTTYVINQDTLLGPYTDADGDGVYTAQVLNPDGTPTGDTVDSDFNALISSPHPEPIPDTFMSATVNADGSITLQYMNADGAVGDPIVIPAQLLTNLLSCDTPPSFATPISDLGVYNFLKTERTWLYSTTVTDVPDVSVGGVDVGTLTLPSCGLWAVHFTVSVDWTAAAGGEPVDLGSDIRSQIITTGADGVLNNSAQWIARSTTDPQAVNISNHTHMSGQAGMTATINVGRLGPAADVIRVYGLAYKVNPTVR